MADVQDASNAPEPSMEEILASIRKIIADEKDPEPPPPEPASPLEDVLELTQLVKDDGSVEDLSAKQAASQDKVEGPPPPQAAEPTPAASTPAASIQLDDQTLVSNRAADSATTSLSALAKTVQAEHMAALGASFTPLGSGSRSLEEIVMDLLRPMIKEWLDQNLPGVVDKLVQKEIERIASRLKE